MKKRENDNCKKVSGLPYKPGCDNRGSSLVEVIVAMLILAIIIVPMLDMFGNATKTNLRAREKQSANSVLENTMEEVRAGNYVLVYNTAQPQDGNLREGGKLCLYTEEENDGTLSGKSFTSALIQQGKKEYQVKLRLEPDGSGLNAYRMPDISTYDSTDCEMVMLDGSSDVFVVEELYRQYEIQEEAEYQERVNEALCQSEEYMFEHDFDGWLEQYEAENGTTPPDDYTPEPFDQDDVWREKVDFATFQNYVQKRTELCAEPKEAGAYTVSYIVFYEVDQSTDSLGLTGAFEGTYEYSGGSGTRFAADKLKHLYVFYQPFTEDMSQEKLIIDVEKIISEEDWKCRLYLAVQGTPAGDMLDMELVTDSSVPMQVMYERLQILAAANVECGEYSISPGNMISTLEPRDMVYNVMLEVIEPESKEVLASTESVIYLE